MATGTPAHEFRELDNAELQSRLKDAKDELCEKHDLHMCVHHYADLEKPEDDESFIRR